MKKLGNIFLYEKIRYILAGTWNTIFGYTITIIIYLVSEEKVNIFVIGMIANIISIFQSYIIYKIFVFKTKGNWAREIYRNYMVYGASGIVSSTLLWVLVDKLSISIYSSQLAVIIIIVLISYTGHKYFTFKS